MRHFWHWVRNEDDSRALYLEGVIAEQSWYADDITPAMFKEELFAGSGPITLHINSVGGDCIAASQIYTMLMDYPGDVTVQIDGLAASAASVIAMAGKTVYMSPTSVMMCHNPFTAAIGDSDEMRRAIQMLDEVKESIINAYQIKTGLSRAKLSHLMDSETWMNARKAKELGFCDEILYVNDDALPDDAAAYAYETKAAAACLMNRVIASMPKPVTTPAIVHPSDQDPVSDQETAAKPAPLPHRIPATEDSPDTEPIPSPLPDNRIKAADLEKRLSLLK